MNEVVVHSAAPRILAAVRRRVSIGEVGVAWRPALDLVWAFLRTRPGLRTDGHDVFVYHHPARRDGPMDVDFGVEVVRVFEPEGDVRTAGTPAGEVASSVHRGPYDRLRTAHDRVHAWAAREGRTFAGTSWEIYGDPTPDPAETETTIVYLLR